MKQLSPLYVEILKIFYGEIFNKKNKFFTRIKRIIARFSISKLFIKFHQSNSKNQEMPYSEDKNFEDLNIETANKYLNNLGIYEDLKISDKSLNKILNYCKSELFNFNRNPKFKIKFDERFNYKDLYIMNIMNPHLNCEEINSISKNKKIINIVKNYIGANPILESTQIFWSVPYFDKDGNPKEPPNKEFGYHYDIDGYKFIKFFIYLTDVLDENCGHHCFVTKDNGKEKSFFEKIYRRVPDQIITNKYNNRVKNIFGPKGKGFLEDTSFYHKGNFPKKERGMLAIIYNLSKW